MLMKKLNFLERTLFIKHEIIIQLTRGKKVVHYGCIDDSADIIDSKISRNIYLHQVITENAKSCIGIDMNSDLMEYLRSRHNIDNIYFGNAEDPGTFTCDSQQLKSTEVLLIPDIIEHLNNPGLMLEAIKKYYPENVSILIMTPNPFSYLNFVFTLFRREFYNEYHTCYFSTNNMKVLLSHYGIKIKKVYPVFLPKDRSAFVNIADKLINRLLFFFTPGFCDNYLYECEPE